MRNYHYHYQTSSALASILSSTLAGRLLGAETQGLAIDFTDMSMVIRDTGTPANSFSGDPNNKLTYSSPSTKWILGANGLYSSGTTLRTSYDASGNNLGVLIEEARTNLCLRSNDLTDAAWTKSSLTTAATATGPDGVANSATTITATAGNATALQAITSGSAARITSAFLKRRTGTGNIDLTQDNGTTWTTQSITSSWARYALSSVTSTNPTVGIRVVTSGDSVDVAMFDHEVGAFVTSPIVTAGSTVTRAADNVNLELSAFPYVAAPLTFYAQGISIAPSTYGMFLSTRDFGQAELRRENTSTGGSLSTGAGTVSATRGGSSTWASGMKIAAAYAANDAAVCVNAGTVATSALAHDLSGTTLWVGSRGGSSFFWNGYIKQIMYLRRRMSNAELQAQST